MEQNKIEALISKIIYNYKCDVMVNQGILGAAMYETSSSYESASTQNDDPGSSIPLISDENLQETPYFPAANARETLRIRQKNPVTVMM